MTDTTVPRPEERAAAGAPETGQFHRDERTRRIAGGLAVLGAVGMFGSAVLMYSTGADLFTAVEDREMEGYLGDVGDHATLLYLHLDLWVLAAVSMSLALAMFAGTSVASASASAGRFLATAAGGAVLVCFPLMAGVIYGLQGHPELAPVGEALGRGAIGADDLATVLIIGFALVLAVRSGRGDWAPTWLVRLAWAPLAVAVLFFVPVSPLDVITGTLIVPVGLVTMISLGVVGLRGSRPTPARS